MTTYISRTPRKSAVYFYTSLCIANIIGATQQYIANHEMQHLHAEEVALALVAGDVTLVILSNISFHSLQYCIANIIGATQQYIAHHEVQHLHVEEVALALVAGDGVEVAHADQRDEVARVARRGREHQRRPEQFQHRPAARAPWE